MSFGRLGALGRGFGRLGVGGSVTTFNLSGSTVLDNATVGTVIGTLSVAHGIGSYTYTLTSNPGTLFSITSNQLKVNAALTAGSDSITIQASNGAGSIISKAFLITVVSSATQSEPFPVIF